MKSFSFKVATDAVATVLHPRIPHMVSRLSVTAMAAFLAMEPAVATAAAAGPAIPVAISSTLGTGVNTIDLSGQVIITPRIVTDMVFSKKTVLELTIDFKGVKGVARTVGREVFVTDAQTIIHRPLLSRDAIEVTFPYYITGNFSSARPATATFAVVYDATSGIRITAVIKDVTTN